MAPAPFSTWNVQSRNVNSHVRGTLTPVIRIYLIWELGCWKLKCNAAHRGDRTCQLSLARPCVSHLAGLHPLTSDLQTTYNKTMCNNPALLYTHQRFHMEERNLSQKDSEMASPQLLPVQKLSFQTWLIAIKILRMALAVTNAASYRKRADIVFFLWHDLWDFIIFWWITVYPECVHDARIFTWWRGAVIASDTNGTTETSHPARRQASATSAYGKFLVAGWRAVLNRWQPIH